MQAAHFGKGDITRTLIRQQSRFPRTAQNLVALEQHKDTLSNVARCGEPGWQAARFSTTPSKPENTRLCCAKVMSATSATTPQRRPSQSDRSQLLVDAPTDAGTHDITHRSQAKRAAFDRAFHD